MSSIFVKGEEISKIESIYKWNGNDLDQIKIYKTQGELEDYPVAYKVFDNIDHEKLFEEFKVVQPYLINQTGTYLKTWFKTRKINWEVAKKELDKINFKATYYRQFNLMEPDNSTGSSSMWTKVLPWVGSYTREVLSLFKSEVIRARYSIAQPGWVLKPHIDFPKPKTNGFRIHIPVKTDRNVQTLFLINDKWEEVYFEEGYVWFMNVSVPHKIVQNSCHERIYLTLDLWTDLDIPVATDEDKKKKTNYLNNEYEIL